MTLLQKIKALFDEPPALSYSDFVSACCGAKWIRQEMVLDLPGPYGGKVEACRSRRVCTKCGYVCDLVDVFLKTEAHDDKKEE